MGQTLIQVTATRLDETSDVYDESDNEQRVALLLLLLMVVMILISLEYV